MDKNSIFFFLSFDVISDLFYVGGRDDLFCSILDPFLVHHKLSTICHRDGIWLNTCYLIFNYFNSVKFRGKKLFSAHLIVFHVFFSFSYAHILKFKKKKMFILYNQNVKFGRGGKRLKKNTLKSETIREFWGLLATDSTNEYISTQNWGSVISHSISFHNLKEKNVGQSERFNKKYLSIFKTL